MSNTRPFSRTRSKDDFKKKLFQTAAEVWGFQETGPEAFDPLVDLLFGAFATELEKTDRKIQEVEKHLLQRLSTLLLPGVYTKPRPAHSILHVQPKSMVQLEKTHQFAYAKEISNLKTPLQKDSKEVIFTPVFPQILVPLQVNCLVSQDGTRLLKNPLSGEWFPHEQKPANWGELWIGLECTHPMPDNISIPVYLTAATSESRQFLTEAVGDSEWMMNQCPIQIDPGFHPELNESPSALQRLTDPLQQLEYQTAEKYQGQFFTAHLNQVWEETLLPEWIDQVINKDCREQLEKVSYWIQIPLKQPINAQLMQEIVCATNCFPAINRSLNVSKRPHRVSPTMNMVPLPSDGHFLDIHKAQAESGEDYLPVPRGSGKSSKTYSIRQPQMSRFDERDAREALEQVLDSCRDEKASFTSLGGPKLFQELKTLQQSMTRLEGMLDYKKSFGHQTHYLILHVEKEENLWVSFWSTWGEFANQIPADSRLKLLDTDLAIENEAQLLVMTAGGQSAAGELDQVQQFRSELYSHNRLVTPEDYRLATLAKLQNLVSKVEVKKGVMVSPGPSQSMTRTLDIILYPTMDEKEMPRPWKDVQSQLLVFLRGRSAGFTTIRIQVAKVIMA